MNLEDRENLSIPFDRAYWVMPGKLLAGCYPGSPDPDEAIQKQKGLLACGIGEIVNLMEPYEIDHSGNVFAGYEAPMKSLAVKMNMSISFQRFPIKDLGIPSRKDMQHILDHIDTSIEKNKSVYVHCWGGRGRTGTVVGCYLARHGYAAGIKVLKLINRLRKVTADANLVSPETDRQRNMVIEWVEKT